MEQCTCRSSTSWKHGKINNAIARLEALIESASEANKNTQKSLIEEAKLQIKQKMSDLLRAEAIIKDWVENNKRGNSFEIKLPTQTQRMVKRAMGKGYNSHNITANGIAHGFNNHGENGKKLGPNSIPVRKEDAVLIPYIMTAPDRVEKGSTDIRNRESVRFYKNLSNGYIVVVEKEQMNSSDDMETINFWIEMSPEATNAQQNVVPDINVRNAILSSAVAKIRKDSETAIEKDVENSVKVQYSLQGNSMTEEEQRIVNEAKANGTFDASNQDIRYSLASDMARDAVMTALEGAGIDVEMATPEMVEDVLRARDAEFMSFATSAEEFRNRAKLAKENVGIVAKGLNEINVKIEKVPRHRFKGSGKEAIEKARNWANNNLIGEHTYHKGKVDEFKYQIEPEAVDKFLSSSSTTNSENLGVHLATLTKLVDVIDNSVDAEIHPNYKKINKVRSPKNGIKDDNMLVHRLYGAIEIDNRIYRVKTTIYEVWNDKNKVHDYRITKVELAESVPSTGNAPTNPTFVSGAKY